MSWFESKEYDKSVEEIDSQIINLNLTIQALIKRSDKDGTLVSKREDIADLIASLQASAEWLWEALDHPSMIQSAACE